MLDDSTACWWSVGGLMAEREHYLTTFQMFIHLPRAAAVGAAWSVLSSRRMASWPVLDRCLTT